MTATSSSLSFIVESQATAIAYLWETTPVLGTKGLPMYANDEFQLPGAPWWMKIE